MSASTAAPNAPSSNSAGGEVDTTGRWSNYQRMIYGTFTPPPFTTSIHALEPLAKDKLDRDAYWYIAGSAGTGETDKTNKDAFKEWRIIPRMLVDSNKRDLRTTLFGVEYSSPVMIAPVGVNGLWHADGEEAVARAANALGVGFCMSSAATRSIERVAEQNGDGQRWYQLYWPRTDDVVLSLLARAKANGFTTLVVTLDTTLLGHRPNDLDNSALPFLHGIGCQVGFSDPVFCKRWGIETTEDFRELKDAALIRKIAMAWLGEVNSGHFRSWEDLAFLQKHWDGPIVLKGIQSVADARKALSLGLQGIVVSNHGGRQIDGCTSSLAALARITSDPIIAASDLTVLFDSGIRCGADVVKALCLGAKAVLLGRPWVYGLAIGGQEGVEHVLKTLLSEVEVTVGLMGCPKTSELGRDFLEKVEK